MNKAYLLTFCLLFASFTGCVGNSEDNDDLISEIENLTEDNKDLNELLANQTGNNDALTSDIANLTEQNNNLIEQVQNSNEDNSELLSAIANFTAQIENLNEQIQNGTEDNDALISEIANLTGQIQSLNEQIQNGTEDNDDLTSEIANLTSQIQNLNERIEDISVYLPFQPEIREELELAVDKWLANPDNGYNLYGYINDWDTSLIIDMSELFDGKTLPDTYYQDSSCGTNCYAKIPINISNWDTSSVTDMSSMFRDTYGFDVDISEWDVSSVTDMSYMFRNADNFNGDISGWDVSSVTDMSGMFYYTDDFNGDISNWDVSSLTNMYAMFYYAENFDQDISDWDVSSVTSMYVMFDGADDLSDDNKCYIHTSFSSNDNWPYDWEEYCEGSNQSHDISITDNMQFDPEELTISVGDTVTWTNNDGMSHTATSTSGPESFDSGNMGSGDTWSFTFTEAGTYEYKCDYHSSMTATIIVNA